MSSFQDDGFSRTLEFKELIDAYGTEERLVVDKILLKYKEKFDEFYKKKREGIVLDQGHRRILNGCIFPFTEDGTLQETGYGFVRASPLSELKVPNLDFLIFSPSKNIAILGEAKGSVNDPGVVVQQTRERIRVANDNLRYIAETYLKSAPLNVEYTLGVSWVDSNEVVKTLVRRGGGVIVWQVGIDSRDLITKLSVVIPPADSQKIHESMRHGDDVLNSALRGHKTSIQYKTFFLESHPVAKMLVLALVDREKPDGVFDITDLTTLVSAELDYCDETTIRAEAEYILRMGVRIGFIGSKDGKYVVNSRSRRANVRALELQDAWIRVAVREDQEQEIQEALKPIRSKYEEKKKTYRKLEEFR